MVSSRSSHRLIGVVVMADHPDRSRKLPPNHLTASISRIIRIKISSVQVWQPSPRPQNATSSHHRMPSIAAYRSFKSPEIRQKQFRCDEDHYRFLRTRTTTIPCRLAASITPPENGFMEMTSMFFLTDSRITFLCACGSRRLKQSTTVSKIYSF